MSLKRQMSGQHTPPNLGGFLTLLTVMSLVGLWWPGPAVAIDAEYGNVSAITVNAVGAATPYPSTIEVTGVVGNITKVTVTLRDIEHPTVSTVEVLLAGPDNATNVVLMSDVGDDTVDDELFLTFDDAAATNAPCFPAGPLPSTGTFKPTNCGGGASTFPLPAPPGPPYGATMSVFNGQNPNGTWRLYVNDPVPGGSGQINGGWLLTITTDAPTAARVVAYGGTRYDGGAVHLQWSTGEEVDHLGFRVYRDTGQGREAVTPGFVAGSALRHGGMVLSTPLSYGLWDQLESDAGGAQYWLEAVDLAGHGTWYGPFVPSAQSGPPPDVQRAQLLTEVGRAGPRQAQMLQASLRAQGARRQGRDLTRQRVLAAQSSVKLGIRDAGWYQVTYEELAAAGFDPAVDPKNLRLFLHGHEQAIQVHAAQAGTFAPGDAIQFYGEGQDTPSTDQQIYWLVAGGWGGQHVPVIDSPAEPGGALSYETTLTWRPRTVYFAGLLNGEAENFSGPPVMTEPLVQPLMLTGVAREAHGGAEVTVALQGVSLVPGHVVQVMLNGAVLGTVTFDGQARQEERFPVAQALLLEGENTLVLQAQGGSTDVSLVDAVQVRYWRSYIAEKDTLHATVEGGESTQTLDGFTSQAIRVFDITQPARPLELAGTVTPGQGYAVSVGLPDQAARTLLALTEAQIKSPVAVTLNRPSRLHASHQRADLIIVTHEAFADAAHTLQAQRQAEGLQVAVIDITDVYDEFNYGEPSPWALRAFLQHVWERWQPQLRYVLLMGDATYDPQDHLGSGMPDYMPTKLVDTAFMETASDDWFVDFDDDGLPDLAIGRLPVRMAESARRVVEKLVRRTSQDGNHPAALLVADITDTYDFEEMIARVKAQLPSSFGVTQVLRGATEDTAAQQQIMTTLNAGTTLVTFAGHGAYRSWRGDLLTAESASTLTNRDQLPVVVAMTCLNGYFQDPAQESLAEALLLAENGGAGAVWASSGMTYAAGQAALLEAWTQLVFGGGNNGQALTLGDAAVRAKAGMADGDVRRTWILFGDPSQRLIE
ncbi:MAG: C25 family cysteine peptidase [Candidatus Entotheonellia bacterium]